MKYTIKATNIITGEVQELGLFDTFEDAEYNARYNVEFTEDEIPAHWLITVAETDVEEMEYDVDEADLEMGFDPYSGCYDFDC